MRILLIRHAEPDYNIDNLTAKGRVEAELLARRLARLPIRDVYVSPLGRAQATAEVYLKRAGKTAETLPWLREFKGTIPDPDTGAPRIAWDLKPRIWTAMAGYEDAAHWQDIPCLQGGTLKQVWQETTDGVDAMMARYGFRKDGPVWKCEENQDVTIALFCHFGIAMAVTGYLTETSPMILWHRILMLPSSVTELVTEERIHGEAAFRMIRMGDLTHLEANGEVASTAGLYPMVYNGIDSTDPGTNGCFF